MTPEQRRLCIEVLGWNQTQFARFIDHDPGTVRRWFSGAREPDPRIDDWLLAAARHMATYPPPGCEKRDCFFWMRMDGVAVREPVVRAEETNPKSSKVA